MAAKSIATRYVKSVEFTLRSLKEIKGYDQPDLLWDTIDLSKKKIASLDQLEVIAKRWAQKNGYKLGVKKYSKDIPISRNDVLRSIDYSNGINLEIDATYYS